LSELQRVDKGWLAEKNDERISLKKMEAKNVSFRAGFSIAN